MSYITLRPVLTSIQPRLCYLMTMFKDMRMRDGSGEEGHFQNDFCTHVTPLKEENFPLWKRFNLICAAFNLTEEGLSRITFVPEAVLHDFRSGVIRASSAETDRIRFFVQEIERYSSATLNRFRHEFSPLDLAS